MSVTEEIQKDYDDFWKPIIERGGAIDMDQLKKELFDYHTIMHEVSKVYDAVTCGRISKPNTMAEFVIDEVNELQDRAVDEAVAEALKNNQ